MLSHISPIKLWTLRVLSLIRFAIIGLLLGLIQLYRWFLSPFIGRQCRFQPTCSVYAQDALKHHGIIMGLSLTLHRLRRCHPIKALGASEGYVYDPVPIPPPAQTMRDTTQDASSDTAHTNQNTSTPHHIDL
jgi:putative membrane protein insertion efficiency factor